MAGGSRADPADAPPESSETPESTAVDADPPPPDEESERSRIQALAASVEASIAKMRENESPDEVLLAEAEALSAVANEMLGLGDLETAGTLLEEAIALLEHPPPGD
jgi:hypothetical protein